MGISVFFLIEQRVAGGACGGFRLRQAASHGLCAVYDSVEPSLRWPEEAVEHCQDGEAAVTSCVHDAVGESPHRAREKDENVQFESRLNDIIHRRLERATKAKRHNRVYDNIERKHQNQRKVKKVKLLVPAQVSPLASLRRLDPAPRPVRAAHAVRFVHKLSDEKVDGDETGDSPREYVVAPVVMSRVRLCRADAGSQAEQVGSKAACPEIRGKSKCLERKTLYKAKGRSLVSLSPYR